MKNVCMLGMIACILALSLVLAGCKKEESVTTPPPPTQQAPIKCPSTS